MTTRDCERLDRWLDEGADPALAPALLAHAAGCARCGATLAAMDQIDALLSAPPAAPPGFTDAVMRRIDRPAPVLPPLAGDDAPWWMGVLIQPATVLAGLVAGLVIWQGRSLPAAAALVLHKLTGWMVASGTGSVLPTTIPVSLGNGSIDLVWLALSLGLAPAIAYGSIVLTGGVTRWVSRRIARA